MQKKKKRLIRMVAAMLLASAYPAFVLGYTWNHVAHSKFPGGRHGPLDAYRHTLASAVVGFTLSPRVVEWVTWLMESAGKDANLMDQRNNCIGEDIGTHARSFSDIEPTVRAQVQRGAVNALDPEQVTWLPPQRWGASRLW